MRVNFFVIINPKSMQNMPQTLVTAFRVPDDKKNFPSQLSRDFPNLTVMDVAPSSSNCKMLDQVIGEFLFYSP